MVGTNLLKKRHLVALLAEGVDRNTSSTAAILSCINVALLAEGVDRNDAVQRLRRFLRESPSSRRAWIEIIKK